MRKLQSSRALSDAVIPRLVRGMTAILSLLLFPVCAYASFIEATIGTAVVNDATASYYNPAALTLLKNPQIIPLGSYAVANSSFTGTSVQKATGFTQTGTANSKTYFNLPAVYLGVPVVKDAVFGLAVVSNFFNLDVEGDSLLRYVQSGSSVDNIDIVPAIGIRINNYLAVGGGVNFSYAQFTLQPVIGFPTLNIPDTQSSNSSTATGVGGDVGFLLTPNPTTLIGVNYRSAITYHQNGTSFFPGTPGVVSNRYGFTIWTPAHTVISFNKFITPTFAAIGTAQWVQWSIFRNIHVSGIATGGTPAIVNATLPFYQRNAWILTLGGNYFMTSKFVLRGAGTYVQSPGNPSYQLANGDSLILGVSAGYQIDKHFSLDGSYAHAFVKNQNININNPASTVTGVNKAYRDAVTLKLTVSV